MDVAPKAVDPGVQGCSHSGRDIDLEMAVMDEALLVAEELLAPVSETLMPVAKIVTIATKALAGAAKIVVQILLLLFVRWMCSQQQQQYAVRVRCSLCIPVWQIRL